MTKFTKVVAVVAAAVALTACGRAPMTGSASPAALAAAAAKKQLPSRSAASLSEFVTNLGAWTFAYYDVNKDGKVTEAEAQSQMLPDETFAAADLNHDGFSSGEEFARFIAVNFNTASMSQIRAGVAALFATLDANKDGLLQPAEVVPTQGVPAPKAGEFSLLSTKASKVSAAEFAAADETKDGVLVRSEFEDLYVAVNKRALGVKK